MRFSRQVTPSPTDTPKHQHCYETYGLTQGSTEEGMVLHTVALTLPAEVLFENV